MELISPDKYNPAGYVATIGFFDGVHRGHQFVIRQLNTIAFEQGLQGLVITFGEHPRKVLQPGFQPTLLTTLPEKLSRLRQNGVDACAVLDFTPEMSRMPAFDFMKHVLKEQYNVKNLLMGYDHRFGHDSHETFDDYAAYGQQLGLQVRLLDYFADEETNRISSSAIRRSLLGGDIVQTNRMLGYGYCFEGKVVTGFKVGRKIGFPTANLQPDNTEKLLPSAGVYAVRVQTEGQTYPGMLNIGKRPTLANGDQTSIEVHIIGFEGDLYDCSLQVEFRQRIRDERKFDGIDALIAQLEQDKAAVLHMYGKQG